MEHVPTCMYMHVPAYVQALDMLLAHMQLDGFPFCRVVGVSGSGQQHGSVYWRHGSEAVLGALSAERELTPQLQVRMCQVSTL